MQVKRYVEKDGNIVALVNVLKVIFRIRKKNVKLKLFVHVSRDRSM